MFLTGWREGKMKSKDKDEWLPHKLATEYDRLACQLLGSGGKITEKYEKNEETFFFFSRLDYLARRIGFRSILIDRNVFDFVVGTGFTKTVLRLYLPEEKEKELSTVRVKGFLRNQAYGKNWSLHRVIYISPFERLQKIVKR